MCAILGTQLFWSFIFGVLMCSRVLADSPRLLVFWEFHTHPPTPQTPKCERARAPCPALPNLARYIYMCIYVCRGDGGEGRATAKGCAHARRLCSPQWLLR